MPAVRYYALSLCVALGLFPAVPPEAEAQQARKRFEAVQNQFAQARNALVEGEQRARSDKAAWEAARAAAIEKHDADPALVGLRKELERARAEYEKALVPARRRLVEDSNYQSLLRERDAKRRQMEIATLANRERAAEEALAAAQAVPKYEQSVLHADQAAIAAKKKLDVAQHEFDKLQTERDQKVDKEPAVEQAAYRHKSAEKQLESARTIAVRAAAGLEAARAQYQAEQAAESAKPAPPPKKKKKKK